MNQLLGLGTDIIECLRIRRMIEKHSESFLLRVYTPSEIHQCQERRHSTEHFAAFWAAKEAVFKALGTRWRKGMNWTDIEIQLRPGGETVAELRGLARELGAAKGIREVRVTIAYCRAYATAHALAMGD